MNHLESNQTDICAEVKELLVHAGIENPVMMMLENPTQGAVGIGFDYEDKKYAVKAKQNSMPCEIARNLIAQVRRHYVKSVMDEVDNWPKEWRELLHEFGYQRARTYYLLGFNVTEARQAMTI